ncbi:MAG: hypothetical protein ABI171_19970 [Collimonas sp.]|uniref:hypothetical protein n=1 Tax=Collimonas sp. TaxID=1963772 RepID=UPI0032641266
MPKNKRPVPRKSSVSPEDKDEAITQQLCDLAIDLAEQDSEEAEGVAVGEALKQAGIEFHKIVKKSLQQKKDDILYDAIERAKYADLDAWQFLKGNVEEASEILLVRRDEGKVLELNAFVVPFFAHVGGGLKREQCFQDQDAFDALSASFKKAQLEGPDATVVLVSHAYHLDEIDSIRYSHLFEMNRDAFGAMADKKLATTTAIESSISGWPENLFGPDDDAVEVRFLLGFSLKATDDAFYQVPEDEAGAEAYFTAREERFQSWTEQVAPLLKRCLVTDGREIDLHFLYQDLFHGGKERGIAEYFTLQMMSELNRGLDQHGVEPFDANAIVGPADVRGEMVLRVNLYCKDGVLLASSEKPLGAGSDLQVEVDDTYDALRTIGVTSLAVAMKFEADGQPLEVQPYEA